MMLTGPEDTRPDSQVTRGQGEGQQLSFSTYNLEDHELAGCVMCSKVAHLTAQEVWTAADDDGERSTADYEF